MATDAELRGAVAEWVANPAEVTIDRSVRAQDCDLEDLVDRNAAWAAFKLWSKNNGPRILLNGRAREFGTAMKDHVEVYLDVEEYKHYFVGLTLHYGTGDSPFADIEI